MNEKEYQVISNQIIKLKLNEVNDKINDDEISKRDKFILKKKFISNIMYKLLIKYYNSNLLKRPDFYMVKIVYNYILFYRQKNKLEGMILFLNLTRDLESKSISSKYLKEMNKFITHLESFIIEEYNKIKDNYFLNIVSFIEFYRKSEDLIDKLNANTKELERIYKILFFEKPNFLDFKQKIALFSHNQKIIEDTYKSLIKNNDSSIYLKQLYVHYYTYVIKSEKHILKIQEDLKHASNEQKINFMDYHYQNFHSFEKRKKGYFLLSANSNSLGDIVLASKQAKDIIHFYSSNIKGKNIDLFRADFCEGTIQNWMKSFFTDSEVFSESLMNKFGFDYFLTKEKFIVLVMTKIRILQNFQYGITFSLFIWPFEFKQINDYCIFIYDFDSGDILGFNSFTQDMFQISSAHLNNYFIKKYKVLNLNNICPDIMKQENINLILQFKKVNLDFYYLDLDSLIKKITLFEEENNNLNNEKFTDFLEKQKKEIFQLEFIRKENINQKNIIVVKVEKFVSNIVNKIKFEHNYRSQSDLSSSKTTLSQLSLNEQTNEKRKKNNKIILPLKILSIVFMIILPAFYLIFTLVEYHNLNVELELEIKGHSSQSQLIVKQICLSLYTHFNMIKSKSLNLNLNEYKIFTVDMINSTEITLNLENDSTDFEEKFLNLELSEISGIIDYEYLSTKFSFDTNPILKIQTPEGILIEIFLRNFSEFLIKTLQNLRNSYSIVNAETGFIFNNMDQIRSTIMNLYENYKNYYNNKMSNFFKIYIILTSIILTIFLIFSVLICFLWLKLKNEMGNFILYFTLFSKNDLNSFLSKIQIFKNILNKENEIKKNKNSKEDEINEEIKKLPETKQENLDIKKKNLLRKSKSKNQELEPIQIKSENSFDILEENASLIKNEEKDADSISKYKSFKNQNNKLLFKKVFIKFIIFLSFLLSLLLAYFYVGYITNNTKFLNDHLNKINQLYMNFGFFTFYSFYKNYSFMKLEQNYDDLSKDIFTQLNEVYREYILLESDDLHNYQNLLNNKMCINFEEFITKEECSKINTIYNSSLKIVLSDALTKLIELNLEGYEKMNNFLSPIQYFNILKSIEKVIKVLNEDIQIKNKFRAIIFFYYVLPFLILYFILFFIYIIYFISSYDYDSKNNEKLYSLFSNEETKNNPLLYSKLYGNHAEQQKLEEEKK